MRVRPFLLVGVCCFLVQSISATVQQRSFETPNLSTDIARNLASSGEYAAAVWRSEPDSTGRVFGEPLRAYILPGEPFYLAAGFRWLPEPLHRYLHVPVTVLFVLATSALAFTVGGRAAALTAGAIATFDPFVVVHGPVWDDTFLAAALEWSVLAFLLRQVTTVRPSKENMIPLALLTVAAGWAALTRLQSQIVLGLIALASIAWPQLKLIRREGWAIAAGIVLALGTWGVRNLLVLGTFFLGSTHDGQTLLHGNHARAREALFQTGVTQSYADMSVPDGLTEVEENRVFRDRGLQYLASRPFDALVTAGLKTAVSLTGVDLSASMSERRNLIALTTNVSLLFAGVLGFRRWWRNAKSPPDSGQMFLMVAAGVVSVTTLAMLAIGPVGLRYRISLVPLTCLWTAFAMLPTRSSTAARS